MAKARTKEQKIKAVKKMARLFDEPKKPKVELEALNKAISETASYYLRKAFPE